MKEEEGILIRDRFCGSWPSFLMLVLMSEFFFRKELNCCMWECAKDLEFCHVAPRWKRLCSKTREKMTQKELKGQGIEVDRHWDFRKWQVKSLCKIPGGKDGRRTFNLFIHFPFIHEYILLWSNLPLTPASNSSSSCTPHLHVLFVFLNQFFLNQNTMTSFSPFLSSSHVFYLHLLTLLNLWLLFQIYKYPYSVFSVAYIFTISELTTWYWATN